MNSDYTPAHSLLVQQSGTGSPSSLAVSNNSVIGKLTGNIVNLSATDIRTLINVANGATANSPDATLLNRANHTGTQLASTISDFAATVRATVLTGLSLASTAAVTAADSILVAIGKLQAQVTLNNAKVTNATHTGDVTGATALTLASAAITGKTTATPDTADYILFSDTSDSGNLKKGLISDLPGGGAGSALYNANPFTSQTSVTVTHDFGYYPVVNVIDNTGAQIIPLSVVHNSVDDFTVTFSISTTGIILSTAGGAPSGDMVLATAQEYTAAKNFDATTLTDGATINWDLDANQVTKVTLGGNRTMAAPTNMKDGGTYILRIIQDGTGTRTVTWNAVFKWSGGTAPTLSTSAGAIDIITFISDGTNMYGVEQLNFS
jgi:hypothetical protein